jgi:hypothetical protein
MVNRPPEDERVTIRVRIGELLLDGQTRVDEVAVADALRRAIELRVTGGVQLPRLGGAIEALDGGLLPLVDSSPGEFVSGIARAVSRAVLP